MTKKTMPPVFVISVARATERREAIRRRLNDSNIRYEIVDGVDGATADLSQYADRISHRIYKIRYGKPMGSGTIGCYLSHYLLWERMINEKIECALIVEDDSKWSDDFVDVVTDIMTAECDWDVVLLHSPMRRRTFRTLCAVGENHHIRQYLRPRYCTWAYLIRLPAAEKLHKYCYKIEDAIDGAWQPYWRWGGKLFCLAPPVVSLTGDESIIAEIDEDEEHNDNYSQTIWNKMQLFVMRKRSKFEQWFYFYFG